MIAMVHRFDQQCTYTSKQTKIILGHTANIWSVEFLSSITHADDIFSVNEKMYGYLIEAGKPFYDKEAPHLLKIFGRLQHVAGQYLPVEFTGVILRYDQAGAFFLGLGAYQDISPRTADESLRQQSEKLTRAIEDHLRQVKRLYMRMHPHADQEENPAPVTRNGGVSKIHIVGPEQLAIKVRHSIEMQKLLATHTPGVEDATFTTQVLQYINQQLGDPGFSTVKFADALNMSRGNLYKKVMRAFNVPPTDLIRRMRLDKAALLLQTTDKPVTEIAFDVGFADSSYFSKCFCAQHGVAPLEFRKRGLQTGPRSTDDGR